jgi:hypothetical protein
MVKKDKCVLEMKRLMKHYLDDANNEMNMYSYGVADGLDMAIEILENRSFYEKESKKNK